MEPPPAQRQLGNLVEPLGSISFARVRVNLVAAEPAISLSVVALSPAGAGGYIEPLAQIYCACGTVISAPVGAGYIAHCVGSLDELAPLARAVRERQSRSL